MPYQQHREDRGVVAQIGDEVLAAQQRGLIRLVESVGQISATSDWEALQEVVESIPLAISVDLALVSVQERRPAGHLFVCAAVGLSARELGRLAFSPLTADQARAAALASPADSLSRELGLLWGSGRWLESAGAAGALLVGSRTGRRPGGGEESLLDLVGEEIAASLPACDRESRSLQRRAAELARAKGPTASRPVPLGNLRRREVQILELYADGLSTGQIAQLLVISPHTVRTHVRNALRNLDVTSRDDAVASLRRRQLDVLRDGRAGLAAADR